MRCLLYGKRGVVEDLRAMARFQHRNASSTDRQMEANLSVWRSRFPANIFNPPMRDDSTTDVMGLQQEVLRLKNRIAELEASQASDIDVQRYRLLIEHSPLCIHGIDLEGRVTSMNQAGLNMLGSCPIDDVIGKKYVDIVAEEDRERIQGLLREALDGNGSEFEFFARDGDRHLVFASSFVPIKNADGKVQSILGVTDDITLERRAQQELRKSERRYRELFDNSLGLMCTHDMDGVLVSINPAGALALGCSVNEATGQKLQDFLAPDVQHEFSVYMERIRTRLRDSGIMKVIGAGGKLRYWAYENALRTEGSRDLVVGHALDVTARLNAERELQKWKYVFSNADWGIVISKAGGDTLDQVNQRFAEMHGYTVEELTGQPLAVVFADEFKSAIQKQISTVEKTGRQVFFRRHVRKDGSKFPVRVDVFPVNNHHGEVAFRVAMIEDITRLRAVEEKERDQEARLGILTENLPAVLWSTDQDLFFTSSTGAGLKSLGLKVGEVVGMKLEDYLSGAGGGQRALEAHRRALDGASVDVEIDFADRDYRVHVEPLRDSEGRIEGTLGLAMDITEEKKVQEVLQQTQKLESIGVLAGGVAHDFNNILLAIMGNAELLAEDFSDDSPEGQLAREITKAARRGGALANSMLAYGGRSRVTTKIVDVNRLVRDQDGLLRAILPKKAVVTYELADRSLTVVGDVPGLRQVVMNLVTNASESLEDAATPIFVRTRIEEVSAERVKNAFLGDAVAPGTFVAVEVEDRGCGMNLETRKRLFDPFYTTKFTGRGLGMASVLGIVKRHRGAIEVRSEVDCGTTMTVLLPESRVQGSDADRGDVEDVAERITILVADDEDQVRSLLVTTLARRGFETVIAADGGEAIEKFQEHSTGISAVVLDVAMPVWGGEEVLQQIRALGSEVPVLLMSGYSEKQAMGLLKADEETAFLQKPFAPRDLIKKLGEMIGI